MLPGSVPPFVLCVYISMNSDIILPITGISSIIGKFILGKTNEFKEVEAPLSPVNKYKPNTVIPDAIKLSDIPDIIMLDFNLSAK